MTRLRVGLCQVPAFDLADAEAALETCLEAVDRAGAQGARLIVLPECAYPAYLLESRAAYDAVARPRAALLRIFGERAQAHGAYVAAGLAIPSAAGILANAICLFGPDGTLIEEYVKTFRWHFDRRWFAPGGRYPVVDLAGVPAGLLICADSRQPEVARSLTVQGARVIVDSTAWVTHGRTPETLRTAQTAYLMAARAIENGAWVVAADKVGVEADTLVYAGRSGVIRPDGAWQVQASADRAEIVVAEIDIAAGGPPVVRRSSLYARLGQPLEAAPVRTTGQEAIVPAASTGRIAVLQAAPVAGVAAYAALLRHHLRVQALQDADLLVVPELLGDAASAAAALDALRAASGDLPGAPMVIAALREPLDGGTALVGYALHHGVVVARHVGSHRAADDEATVVGDDLPPLLALPFGRVALLVGVEGLVPEVARDCMLRGADILCWPSDALPVDAAPVARARADENRVYVALAEPRKGTSAGGGMLVEPSGTVIADGPADRDVSFAAPVLAAAARVKAMAPGTDAVLDRLPATYGPLLA